MVKYFCKRLFGDVEVVNEKYKIAYIFINFHDSDFYIEMCRLSDLFIDMFYDGELNINNKEAIKETVPHFMASFSLLKDIEDNSNQSISDRMSHLIEYFSKGTTYLFDIEDIKKYIEEYNYESECPISESGIYDDKTRLYDPSKWMDSLKLNLNAESILIQFVLGHSMASYITF